MNPHYHHLRKSLYDEHDALPARSAHFHTRATILAMTDEAYEDFLRSFVFLPRAEQDTLLEKIIVGYVSYARLQKILAHLSPTQTSS